MYESDPFKDNSDFLQKLNHALPEGEFIAVFGTSHSYGACKILAENKNVLDEQHIWINIVSDRVGLPVVNFSIEGNQNHVIISQIIDFIKLPKAKNCRMAMLEVRIGERALKMSSDLNGPITEVNESVRKVITKPKLSDLSISKDVLQKFFPAYNHSVGRVRSNNHFFTWRMAIPEDPERFQKALVNSLTSSGIFASISEIPSQIIKKITDYKNHYVEFYWQQDIQFVDNLAEIQTMITLLSLNGIPCKWFCFDYIASNYTHDRYASMLSTYDQTTDIKKYMVSDLLFGATTVHLSETAEQHFCDCGHRNKKFHTWLANKIYTDIEDELK